MSPFDRHVKQRRRLHRLAVPASAVSVLTVGAVAAVAIGMQADAGTGSKEARAAAVVVSVPGGSADVKRRDAEDVSQLLAARDEAVSRSAPRVTLRKKPKVKDREFMTAPLNLWPAPREKGEPLVVLARGSSVGLTGPTKGPFAQILHGGQLRWVREAYLVDVMPKPKPKPKPDVSPHANSSSGTNGSSGGTRAATGLSTAPCPDGSATESGLTPSAITMFRAVCNAFPALSTYGGYAARGEHSGGQAIDFMVADAALGQAVANWVRANAGQLNIYDVIWAQRIWTPARAAEGWRYMPDRGSATANHMDHVHIKVN